MSSDASQALSTSQSGVPQIHPAPAPPSPSNRSPSPRTADLRHITTTTTMNPHPTPSPAMKERTVSASTDRSGRAQATQHLMSVSPPAHRLGSRSPASIPSSPTSVHSSSSAIFERDIEPSPSHPLTHTHQGHPSNPHRTPRSKGTETLDQSVPSVLDSAAAALLAAGDDPDEASQIAVEAPAHSVPGGSRAASALGSPIGRGSRSPSPTMSAGGGGRARTSMLLNLPSPVQSSIVPLPISPVSSSASAPVRQPGGSPPFSGSPVRPPPVMTNFSSGSGELNLPGGFAAMSSMAPPPGPPRSITPTSTGGSTHYETASSSSSPTTTTLEHPPHPLPSATATATSPLTPTGQGYQFHATPSSPTRGAHAQLSAYTQQQQHSSHPPSPAHGAAKRLSFVSYNDILASTPVSTLPLSSLTSPGSVDPPPHLPSVSLSVGAVGYGPGSGPISPVGSISPMGGIMGVGMGSRSASASAAASARNSVLLDGMMFGAAADVKEPSGGAGDEVVGEWEREGLGRGLEERLEALMAVGPGKA